VCIRLRAGSYNQRKDEESYQEDKDSWNCYWNRRNVYVTFQYGEGVIKTPSGTPMLPHILKYDYCTQCLKKVDATVEDCLDRRFTSMAEDTKEGKDISHHIDAYETWHRNKRRLT
jgi:hypothetical protein